MIAPGPGIGPQSPQPIGPDRHPFGPAERPQSRRGKSAEQRRASSPENIIAVERGFRRERNGAVSPARPWRETARKRPSLSRGRAAAHFAR